MSAAAGTASNAKAATADSGAESPTTARPLEMDDDDVQETTGIVGEDGNVTTASRQKTTAPTAAHSTPLDAASPPQPPPKPVSQTEQNVVTLKEAFPTVEDAVIRAVLRASGGHVEPAFHALLEMTDPEAAKNEPRDDTPTPQQPPPQVHGRGGMSQVEADERYARQLAEHYDNVGSYEARTSNRSRAAPPHLSPSMNDDDREHSFIDDDLPVIRENLRKGFLDTQTKVNGWITNLKKRIEEGFDEYDGTTTGPSLPPRRQGEASRDATRRSGDYHRYDADPEVLSDDFAGMGFAADGTSSTGPAKKTTSPQTADGRRVGFKPDAEEINMYDASPTTTAKDPMSAAAAKASKWQPLSNVEPKPMADNDPFSLGDSEDEKETKDKPKEAKDNKPMDAKADDGDRVKTAAAEAMADSLVDAPKIGEPEDKKT
ncbi:hypothetical protein L249_3262 [Ophiocordyceps polyrhachis-furcata BCC 54312]|uniref:CUE domain-containing protein n=1 Tax=Ophiocordyceps polyrhachis-furcata BCC 54312 TaxID=1330021 RepID=A0A367LNV6_9HYPO|nr:hypothetical protein L249_3262 [Ophiocordyceps polyrhachis-furcata BCC 54312]